RQPSGSEQPRLANDLAPRGSRARLARPGAASRGAAAIEARRLSRADSVAISFDASPPPPYISGMAIDEIIENFALLDEWDERYRYLIELGRALEPLPDAVRSDANKVQGCASQVWLATSVTPNGTSGPVLSFIGDSDAHIVRGLIAVLFALFSDRPAKE